MHDGTDRLHLSSLPLCVYLSSAASPQIPSVSVSACIVDVLSSHFCYGAPLSVLTYTLITQTARNTCLEQLSCCPLCLCVYVCVSLLMTSSVLENRHTGSVLWHIGIKWRRPVSHGERGVLETSVQTGRSRQEESEGEGSGGAVECSELGSVACQTLP